MPKISVIIPCYNVERYIDRCLASVIGQTIGIGNLEIIIVDDASSDSTWAHLQVWEQRYTDNIILIRHEVNMRQGAARNTGLLYASADWIAFVDADDWLEPDYFELLYGCAMTYICDIVSCKSERESSESLTYFDETAREDGEDLYILADMEEIRKEVIVSKFMTGVWGMIIHKSFIENSQIRFPEGVAYEDMYWQSLVRIYAMRIYILSKKLYHYFVNDNSTVLARNQNYHVDWLTVWVTLWAEYDKRGLLDRYRQELEYDSMENAVGFLRLLILRYDNPSFSLFQLTRQILRGQAANPADNPYVTRLTGLYGVFLRKLYEDPFNRLDFQNLVKYARNQWGIN